MLRLLFCCVFIPTWLLSAEDESRGYKVRVGDNAPKFSLTLPDGSLVTSKELKGKVVMLQFTASWCSVCIKEMPHIESEIWLPLKAQGLVLYGVDYKEPKEKVLQLIKATGITYPIALDTSGVVFYSFAKEGAGVTRNVIIDQKGKIAFLTRLFNREEFEQMKEVIHKLLE